LSGPDSALALVDVPEPEASHMMTPGSGVVVDVHAAGVSFPEVLQTRGEYQFKPPLPFVPGCEVAGVVRSAPEGASVSEGDRVAAFCMLGAFAEVAVAPEYFVFPLSEDLDYGQGAGLILNYHTAYFALKLRGRLAEGDTYGTLLILILVAYTVMAIVEDTKWSRTIVGVCFGATLLLWPVLMLLTGIAVSCAKMTSVSRPMSWPRSGMARAGGV